MTEAVATIKGRKLDARYTLLDKLGAGGQGEVWRAHDGTRGVDIALKVLNAAGRSDDAWSILEHEYGIASRLDHPSILKVFPPEQSGDAMVLPMELASGGDLRRLRGAGFLEIIPVLLELAQALEHAHARGVVHRDLKPGNVLFDARGRARLADFGVAETAMTAMDAQDPAPDVSARDTNRHGFSPFTASPAQLRGEPPTPADDIYGLGALAYELLSGYPPYYPHFDKKRAIEEPVPTLVPTRQIPPLLGTLVMHMLAKDPRKRPRTMREVIDELDSALNDTLTYDFDSVAPSTSQAGLAQPALRPPTGPQETAQPGAAQPGTTLSGAAPPGATQVSRASAASTSDLPARAFDWTPASRDRRSSADRRGRRREDFEPSDPLEPMISPDAGLAGARPNREGNPPNREGNPVPEERQEARHVRSGAEALARIDAALERAASGAESDHVRPNEGARTRTTPPQAHPAPAEARPTPAERRATPAETRSTPPQTHPASAETRQASPQAYPMPPETTLAHSAPITPAEAAAIVAAARAAASKPLPAASSMWPHSGRPQPASASSGTASEGMSYPPAAPPMEGRTTGSPPAATPQHAAPPQSTAPPTSAHAASPHTPPPPGPMHVTWGEIPLDGLPKVARLQPIRPRRWPWVLFALVAAAAAAVYLWLPELDTQALPPEVAAVVAPLQAALAPEPEPASQVPSAADATKPPEPGHSAPDTTPAPATAANTTPATATNATAATADTRPAAPPSSATKPADSGPQLPAFTAGQEQRLRGMRQTFDSRLAGLEARGAGVWGGREFAMARTRAAESVGARDAGNPRMAQERLAAALKLLDILDRKAPQQNVSAVLPLLADAQHAEAAQEYARAAQDYSQALSLDPGNAAAKAGQARSNAAFGDDNYAKAVGAGFAALGAGRLDEAHDAFVKARSLKPNGAEASEGLRRVGAALTARGFASMRQRAVGLEAQERWEEAERTYEDVLAADPSLAFAQEGKARTSSRADLSARLQQLLDRPDRLASAGVREDARALLETARAQSPQGPVIRSQIARLEILLPGFDKPVRLSLLSDNSTQVVISSIGSFGTFSRRDIELRPGKYTVVGTRNGFRDVRREITVAPGQEAQTIRVTCSDPI